MYVCFICNVVIIFIPCAGLSGGDPAAHGFAGTSDRASIPSLVSNGGDLAAYGLAGTSIMPLYQVWFRVEVILRPTGSQATPINVIELHDTPAEVISHASRTEAWRNIPNANT